MHSHLCDLAAESSDFGSLVVLSADCVEEREETEPAGRGGGGAARLEREETEPVGWGGGGAARLDRELRQSGHSLPHTDCLSLSCVVCGGGRGGAVGSSQVLARPASPSRWRRSASPAPPRMSSRLQD